MELMQSGSWVASKEQIGKVKAVQPDGTLDIVIYARSGERLGRVSPVEGGPRGYEPCCEAEGWHPIREPRFPLKHCYYLHELLEYL